MSPDKQIPARFAIVIAAIEQELDEILTLPGHELGRATR